MTRIIICPYCHLPQSVTQKPSDPPGEIYCPNCSGVVPWGRPAAARSTTVPWIDDDRVVLGACAPLRERRGHRVLVAADGAAGLATARQERPDAILLDVMMPAQTGFEVCQQLRADPKLKAIPVIPLTTLGDAGIGRMRKKTGATTTICKPYGPEYIVEGSWVRCCPGRVTRPSYEPEAGFFGNTHLTSRSW